jgi:hypothetical protein
MSRAEDYELLNCSGQHFQVHVGFGNQIRIAVDGNPGAEPFTIYPEDHGLVPSRPTAVLGPHRIGFVGEPVIFYGGYSYARARKASIGHTWSGTGSPTITTQLDYTQVYMPGAQPAFAEFTWDIPGIYEVSLKVYGAGSEIGVDSPYHIGTRQVIVYPANATNTDVIEISGLAGSIEQGGWACQVKMQGDLSYLPNARDIQGYIPVVIWATPAFEVEKNVWESRAVGLNWDNDDVFNYRDDPRILFSGYLVQGSVEVNSDFTVSTFEARTAEMILEQLQTNAYGFFESANDGKGITFNDLTIYDVIRHMVQEHTNFMDWHDSCLFSAIYHSEDDDNVVGTQMEYKDWTFNSGMYWSNIRDAAENQFERAWFDNRGCLYVLPDRNMWSPDIWYHNPNRPEVRLPLEQAPVGRMVQERTGPADMVPIQMSIVERLTGDVSYYKIIASLSYMNAEWGADYPAGAPAPTSGKWVLVSGKYYSDDDQQVNWDNLWNFTFRGYAAANARYTIRAIFGVHPYWRLGDLIEVIYEDSRVSFTPGVPERNYFEVESISYDINVGQMTWQTTYSLRELTTYNAPSAQIPPLPAAPE